MNTLKLSTIKNILYFMYNKDDYNNIYKFRKKINKKIELLLILVAYLVFSFLIFEYGIENNEYVQDELTIVSSYYKVKSKHKPREYLDWINNIVKLNKSIVFFSDKKFMPHLKKIRPKELYNKTIFKTIEIKEFYSYRNFIKDFANSWKIDFEKKYHTIPLYLIWAEKCSFLRKVIEKNYFNSTCFYWVDAGYFRKKKEMDKYIDWPSTKKCYEDQRLLIGQLRNISDSEKEKIISFDLDSHIYLQKNLYNVAGNVFGGQAKNILKFINLYYSSLKLFLKHNLFIGKDQNVFTYIALSHPEIVKLVYCESFFSLKSYLS